MPRIPIPSPSALLEIDSAAQPRLAAIQRPRLRKLKRDRTDCLRTWLRRVKGFPRECSLDKTRLSTRLDEKRCERGGEDVSKQRIESFRNCIAGNSLASVQNVLSCKKRSWSVKRDLYSTVFDSRGEMGKLRERRGGKLKVLNSFQLFAFQVCRVTRNEV